MADELGSRVYCDRCEKTSYFSRKRARKARKYRDVNTQSVHVYTCPFNSTWWHVGHLPWEVMRGLIDRRTWYSYRDVYTH